ncbi:MAG: GT4 family glycosyltransferase PelF [Caldilineaceae bacterium]|nr:GT4 family glycosyltransferase PelF [Caldilineaceae bacterium]
MAVRLLHLITELSSGGAQSVLLRLVERMDRAHYQVTIVCLYNGDKAVAQQLRALGLEVIDLGMTRKWRLDAFVRLYWLLRQRRPAILHTWLFHANIPGRLLGRLAGVPIIIGSEHTMGQEGKLRQRLNRLTAPLADQIICIAQKVADFAHSAIGIPRAKLVVIPNGVDTQSFAPPPTPPTTDRQPRIFGFVGRLHPVKGLPFLLEAFAQVVAQCPEQQLWLIGEGSERQRLAQQRDALGLTKHVTFWGARQDVAALLQQMDLFVLPSHWEGMPMVLLEAMAVGLPVVATAVGGTPEVVVPGETGYLVPPADPPALAQALLRFCHDPALCQRLGAAGRQRVEQHFSIEQNVAQTVALYEKLLRLKRVEE